MNSVHGRTCRCCGGRVMDAVDSDLCAGCQLDRWIPEWFERAEQYAFPPGQMVKSATLRPPTGRPILDETMPPLASKLARMTQEQLLAMLRYEQTIGLDDESNLFN